MAFMDWFEHKDPKTEDGDYDTVKVVKGDSLWKIAEELTGDGNNWKQLADANPDKGWDETYTIEPGEELKVPKSWSEEKKD